jgi:hypothetical protein
MINRVPRIMGAYLAASVAAGFVLALELVLAVFVDPLLQGRWPPNAAVPPSPAHLVLLMGAWSSFLIFILAFVPAVAAIALAEARRLRSAAFYACAGVIAAMLAWGALVRLDRSALAAPGQALRLAREQAFLLLAIAAAGLIGGLVYWGIAGRSAGAWVRSREQP